MTGNVGGNNVLNITEETARKHLNKMVDVMDEAGLTIIGSGDFHAALGLLQQQLAFVSLAAQQAYVVAGTIRDFLEEKSAALDAEDTPEPELVSDFKKNGSDFK